MGGGWPQDMVIKVGTETLSLSLTKSPQSQSTEHSFETDLICYVLNRIL